MFRLRFPEVSQAFEKILKKAKVNFEVVEEGCCGALLFLTGFQEEAKENAVKTLKKLEGKNYEALVTGCPACYRCFSKFYPDFGIEVPFEVMHVSHMLEELLKGKKLKLKEWNVKVTYHDPCELGRHCGVYDPPRSVLRSVPGLELLELELTREESTCCGGGGGAWALYAEVCMEVAREKLINEVLPLKVDALVTSCPTCYMNFYYNVERYAMPLKIYDLTQVIELALKE